MEESFQRLLRGLYLAVIFMFLLLVAQFRSLIEPFNMIFSLSLMLTGILGGLLLAHQTFSTVSILAVVILSGHDDDGGRADDRPDAAAASGGHAA